MQVKYIWIEEYKNLKSIGFNLKSGSNEIFDYVDGNLKISYSEDNFPPAFYAKNIKGITTIVGKNGSGKTNFSEFLNYNLAHAKNGGLATYIKSKGIIVLEKKILIQNDLIINNQVQLEEKGFEVIRFENAPLDNNHGGLPFYKMEKNKYIYYNPNCDFRVLPMRNGSDNIINISTNYLTWNDVYNSRKHRITSTYSYEKDVGTDLLLAYYRNEKLRESDLILNYSNINKLISRTPSLLKVTLDHSSENNLLNLDLANYKGESSLSVERKRVESFLTEKYNALCRLIYFTQFKVKDKKLEQENGDGRYNLPLKIQIEYFERLFLLNFLRIYIYLNSEANFSNDFLLFFIYNKEVEFIDKKVEELLLLKKQLSELLQFCKWEQNAKYLETGFWIGNDKNEIQVLDLYRNVHIDTSSKKALKALNYVINTSKDLLKGELHFHYQFNHQLSSGEQNLLNFYSRFYWAKEQVVRSENGEYGIKGERIVIFIDEGEIALHPEWQRRYFKLVVDFLSNLFDDREIQLVLTTHSPFVLSDIPKEHIIFLKPNKETRNAEIANFNRDETFGANIYTLLSDSFFMEEGTIGEFAKGKIEKVLSLLSQTDELNFKDINFIDTVINAVGEPLIKMQLEKLRTEKLEESIIQRMQKRIDELEANQNKRSDDQD